ncbi:MAG TPA: DUF493 domain-containing protein [Mariprofundaceae bacterium]|nr:DUF493 domain-containing protein [Mariprofundaceae bacterium]
MNNQNGETSPLSFPCQFPIKVMGIHSNTFENEIVIIARRLIPDLGEGAVRSRPSSSGKYLSVTLTFTAVSREQLDSLYLSFKDHPGVKMVL